MLSAKIVFYQPYKRHRFENLSFNISTEKKLEYLEMHKQSEYFKCVQQGVVITLRLFKATGLLAGIARGMWNKEGHNFIYPYKLSNSKLKEGILNYFSTYAIAQW